MVEYVRVSSIDQKLSSGTGKDRAVFKECVHYVRDRDVVRVPSMNRLAWPVGDLRSIIDEVLANGASVKFVMEGPTYSPGPSNVLANPMLNMLGSFAEYKRELIRKRQAEGLQLAQNAAGKCRGPGSQLMPQQLDEIRGLEDTGVPKAEVTRRSRIDQSTFYRLLATTTER
ncbi:recombinase family protein [Arthrobacter zhaoguopingii]|uniref:recombinase family protein n=1 Tax=Arthrobacter zhaoguopingii TaxID=2681491 RepID=UPI00135C57E5|nr:recombinase family protein [Arthrobacter zhaoguopingii]